MNNGNGCLTGKANGILLVAAVVCYVLLAEKALAQVGLPDDQEVSKCPQGVDPFYRFYGGTAHTLKSDGNWKDNADWMVSTSTGVMGGLTGQMDAEFFTLEDLKGKKESTQTGSASAFNSGAGVLRFDTYVNLGPFTSFQFYVTGGIGFTSVPDGGSVATAKSRTFAGLSSVTHFNNGGEGAIGRLFIGHAVDPIWQGQEVTGKPVDFGQRWIIDGLLEVPIFKGNRLFMAGRLFADLPVHGKGGSDMRVSLLVSVPFDEFIGSGSARSAEGNLLNRKASARANAAIAKRAADDSKNQVNDATNHLLEAARSHMLAEQYAAEVEGLAEANATKNGADGFRLLKTQAKKAVEVVRTQAEQADSWQKMAKDAEVVVEEKEKRASEEKQIAEEANDPAVIEAAAIRAESAAYETASAASEVKFAANKVLEAAKSAKVAEDEAKTAAVAARALR